MTGVLMKGRKDLDTEAHREESHMNTEAKTEVTQPRAKERRGLPVTPEARRETWNTVSLRAFKRNQSCQQLDFRLLAS